MQQNERLCGEVMMAILMAAAAVVATSNGSEKKTTTDLLTSKILQKHKYTSSLFNTKSCVRW